MKFVLSFFLLLSLFLRTAIAEEIICDDGGIKITVNNLGISADRIKQDMNSLSQSPYQAVGCLIKELNVVKEKRILPSEFKKNKATLHIIWCIRTLRYLSGLDFKGQTKYRFTKKEKTRTYWLTKENKDNIPFFAVWMSRDSIYIAPMDAQKEIIEKWKQWYLSQGKSFNYQTVEDINDWYF